MPLSQSDKKRFRTIGHKLKPIVTISSKGFSESVQKELDRALNDHELIKIKLFVEDSDEKKSLLADLPNAIGKHTEIVQSIGHTVLLYRASKKPNPRLSNLLRNQ